METVDVIKDEDVDTSFVKDIPFLFVKNNLIMPIKKHEDALIAAVADDGGRMALHELAGIYGLKPVSVMAKPGVIIDAINRFYGQAGSAEDIMENISGEDFSSVATEFESPRDILELTEEAPIIRLLNALLQQAVKEKASDIHIEPYEKELDVRIRIDGILNKVLSPPKIIQDALISRIKIMASLDIAEKRLPQDGRIRLLIGGKDIDIRVSIVPTIFGERAVLRLLDRRRGIIRLHELGLDKSNEVHINGLLNRTSGIILVTGPTGSGKTTTLYAALNNIKSEERNIITVEDPVEYQLKGVGQIHVNPRSGLTFASGLRSILRQDPDVIMVGEIRDFETAEIAIQASLTGHLVLSTLHTNDAASAITRLLDMGIEPYLAASSLEAILAQRLVRVICPYCKESYDPPDTELAYFAERELKYEPKTVSMAAVSSGSDSIRHLYRGKGCDKCRNTGYIGRLGIFELMVIDSEIRRMIIERADSQTIKSYAMSSGMKTLYMDGMQKARDGETTIGEVFRVIQKDYIEV